MFNTKSPSIRNWFNVLNWNNLPNFGNCHSSNDVEHFKRNYYCHSEIDRLYTNIVTTISSGLSAQNIRIAGEPGAGKTSFLYAFKYMCEHAEDDSELSRFSIFIIHINRTYDSNNDFYVDEANRNIIDAWKHFYNECGFLTNYEQIKDSSKSQKELLNRLSDYYKGNKSEFSKILIVAIDDVDLLSGEQVSHAVEHLLRSIEINSVKKWLSIRRVTLENYNGATKKKIEEFFPDPYEFPSIPLDELIEYRIKNTSGQPDLYKNPFSKFLCNEIISPICEKNLRESLGLAKSLLEENLPGKFSSSTDETVIHNFIQRSSVKTLCSSQKLIDLHSDSYRLTSFPLAVDILGCAQFHTDENIIFGAVNDCCTRRNALCENIVGGDDHIHKIRSLEFNEIVELLVEHSCLSKTKDRLFLTEKGRVTIGFALRDYYFDYCEKINRNALTSSLYWNLSSKKLDHQEILGMFITWRNKSA
ncbi:hypothetical protein RUK17_003285 [Vibrio cholerae]|uniref:hypothetical protein n=1 Tax=Vibrio cholerae TaxID=666 RepID=UPI000BA98D69|nr:hypothetical protein [Vibrio cholerae]EJX9126141.1 hypothetical protein [Vibrio cholerae]EJY0789440.1 hypothetical protein [Vibrio cholerae]ELJ8469391.1 hypothetical protein [Vibrio cholerae]PAS27191.1 hypothetical protein CGT72_18450 [Vibrio cholerae]